MGLTHLVRWEDSAAPTTSELKCNIIILISDYCDVDASVEAPEGFDADPGPTFYINAEPVLNFTWLVKHYYLINITQLFFTFYFLVKI